MKMKVNDGEWSWHLSRLFNLNLLCSIVDDLRMMHWKDRPSLQSIYIGFWLLCKTGLFAQAIQNNTRIIPSIASSSKTYCVFKTRILGKKSSQRQGVYYSFRGWYNHMMPPSCLWTTLYFWKCYYWNSISDKEHREQDNDKWYYLEFL